MSELLEAGMEEEQEIPKPYHIDLDWYHLQGRSFITLASSRLCDGSHDKKVLTSEANILNAIKQCCSKKEDYIKANTPILETVFRLFLASGNQPATLEQLRERLQRLGSVTGEVKDYSVAKLKRIIESDRYYGFGVAVKPK